MLRRLPIFLLAFLLRSTASACSCSTSSFEDSYAKATVIALVEVLGVTPVKNEFSFKGHKYIEETQSAELQIHATWKGKYTGRHHVEGGGACGFYFLPGEHYLLYGYLYEGKIATSMCSRTMEYSRIADELTRLGQPKYKDQPSLRIAPREHSGLTISLKPTKSKFTIFDQVAFDLAFQNRSKKQIVLPSSIEAQANLIDLVIRHNKAWWSTIKGSELIRGPMDWRPLAPGESRTMRVAQKNYVIRELGEYAAQAVIHNPVSKPGVWNGYVFSEPTVVSMVEN